MDQAEVEGGNNVDMTIRDGSRHFASYAISPMHASMDIKATPCRGTPKWEISL
jgi:hypothetical protein